MDRNQIYKHIAEEIGVEFGVGTYRITKDELLEHIHSLEDREYICGIYWTIKLLYPDYTILLDNIFKQDKNLVKQCLETWAKNNIKIEN